MNEWIGKSTRCDTLAFSLSRQCMAVVRVARWSRSPVRVVSRECRGEKWEIDWRRRCACSRPWWARQRGERWRRWLPHTRLCCEPYLRLVLCGSQPEAAYKARISEGQWIHLTKHKPSDESTFASRDVAWIRKQMPVNNPWFYSKFNPVALFSSTLACIWFLMFY